MNLKVLTAKQMAAAIGCDKVLVVNVLAAFKIEPTHQVDQTKFYPEWTINAVKAECQRRQQKHKAALKKKWLATTAGRLATAFKRGGGCYLNQQQVRELLSLTQVQEMIADKRARLEYEDDEQTTAV
jgi:hypothetical protein